ncbi:MAG: hypothetical protein JW940_03725 [Polyangiaceae bacterium]|nr:hypothetical protein [Polyangiaceae bacterium]
MPSLDLVEKLRSFRKLLVLAAESAFEQASNEDWKLPDRSQFSKLVAVCSEASCAEEIINYLKYQAHRQNAPWGRDFAREVVAQIKELFVKHGEGLHLTDDEEDPAKVEAWRLYATYLAREFAYQDALRKAGRAGGQAHRRDR